MMLSIACPFAVASMVPSPMTALIAFAVFDVRLAANELPTPD
jgi:hypothetical protein